mmetsp:Transcript_184888/g.586566  ORF Transcript_184888/g.586566 Transcript_184888/m.586566 type:complete len:206 (-) Transcript_184888:91-708(-)
MPLPDPTWFREDNVHGSRTPAKEVCQDNEAGLNVGDEGSPQTQRHHVKEDNLPQAAPTGRVAQLLLGGLAVENLALAMVHLLNHHALGQQVVTIVLCAIMVMAHCLVDEELNRHQDRREMDKEQLCKDIPRSEVAGIEVVRHAAEFIVWLPDVDRDTLEGRTPAIALFKHSNTNGCGEQTEESDQKVDATHLLHKKLESAKQRAR